ncbi:MAG: NAD(P)-dependent oxidoreductase [Rhodospirillales bacterium]|nr:NAD(P)-dependent oxidoreductase [Rhodospirillales bacterium]
MATAPAIGFIGFGEAAPAISKGLKGEGVDALFAYDIAAKKPELAARFQAKAKESGVTLVDSMAELAKKSEIVFSSVTCSAAVDVAKAMVPHLSNRHFYVDINSAAPEVKREVEKMIAPSGAKMVEAAAMDAATTHGHKIPLLLCGKEAKALAEILTRYGMRMEVLGPEIGPASATKMFRSIMIKGMEALFIECALASSRFGVAERVFGSLTDSYPGIDWNDFATHLMQRTALHAERRAHEMEEVSRTLESIGETPIMSKAAVARLMGTVPYGLKARFGDKAPDHYRDVVAAIREGQKK